MTITIAPEPISRAAARRGQAGAAAGWLLRQSGLFALYLALGWALFAGVVVWHDSGFLAHPDGTNQTYAWTTFLFRALDAGKIPWWDFSTLGGTSMLGEIQPALLYPPNLLFHLLFRAGDANGVEAIIVIHMALSALLMHGYLRVLGVRPAACFAGAMAFAFIGAVARQAATQANIHAGLAWMPLVFTLVTLAFRSPDRLDRLRWAMLAGLAWGLTILAGHMQPFIQIGMALALLAVVQDLRRPWLASAGRIAEVLGTAGVTAVLFTAAQLWFGREYLKLVYRSYGAGGATVYPHVVPYAEYAWSLIVRPDQLYKLLFPDFNALGDADRLYFGWAGLALAVIGAFAPRRQARFAAGLAILALLLSLGGWTPLGWISYHLPFINSMREPARYLFLFAFAAAMLVAFGFERVMALTASAPRWPVRAVAPAVLALFLAEIVHYDRHASIPNGPLTPGAYYNTAMARRLEALWAADGGLYRVWVEPPDLVPMNLGEVRPMLMARGHRATLYRPYIDYLAHDWNLQGASFDKLAIRYVVTREPVPGLTEVARLDGLILSERPHALPMFWMVGPSGAPQPAPIRHVSWDIDAVTVELDSPPAGPLVFAQAGYPGWRVSVDGAPRGMGRIEIFSAVELHGGEHSVRFAYRPRGLAPLLGLMAAVPAAALAVCLAVALRDRRRARAAP